MEASGVSGDVVEEVASGAAAAASAGTGVTDTLTLASPCARISVAAPGAFDFLRVETLPLRAALANTPRALKLQREAGVLVGYGAAFRLLAGGGADDDGNDDDDNGGDDTHARTVVDALGPAACGTPVDGSMLWPGCVLVRTVAAGVNFADVCVRQGLYASAEQFVGWPIVPGFEFTGTVVAIGDAREGDADAAAGDGEAEAHPGVPDSPPFVRPRGSVLLRYRERASLRLLARRGIGVGTRVVGITRFGAYSTHVVVPGDQLFPLPAPRAAAPTAPPPGAAFDEAMAGFFAVFLTAYYLLHEQVHPHCGDVLLVHSAAGGVGQALCQLGALAGCRVVGVVGAPLKVAAAREAGAAAVVDKSREPLWERLRALAPDGFDAVFDANGPETLRGSFDALAKGGKLCVYGFHGMLSRTGHGRSSWLRLAVQWLRLPSFDPFALTGERNRSVLGCNLSFLFDRLDLIGPFAEQLMAWLADGKIRPVPCDSVFALCDVADAHRRIESAMSVGKIILRTA